MSTLIILVAGGAGFLGSHLCEELLAIGHQVICLDNLSTGSRANIAHLEAHPLFTFFEKDITDPLDFKVDQIYNLACPASPPHYQKDPLMTIRTCVVGLMNLLDLAERNNAKLLQASTSEVYGDPTVHPQTEEYVGHVNPIGPRACYDEGKRIGETLCFEAIRQKKLDVKVVRIFNTYGPRMQADDGRVVSNFIVQALKGEPLTIYGEGSQTRSFCYASDLIRGFILMMESGETGPINLGNPVERSILDFAKLIQKEIDPSSTLVYKPLPQDDPKQRCPDITRAKELLGWEPTVSIEEGLLKTIDYFRTRLIGAER